MNKQNDAKNTEISERVLEILSYLGETKNAFASKLGYNRAQTIYDITEGKSAPSYDFFKKFQMSEYSDIINIDWLLTGRGSMLRDDTEKQVPTPSPEQPEILSYLEKQLKEKEKEIGELNQEIGRLKALITVLEEGGEGFKDVEDAGVADVG